jgi:hypothetical protein
MHLGIFVDRFVDNQEQAGTSEREDVFVQIGITTPIRCRAIAISLQSRMQCCAVVGHFLHRAGMGGLRYKFTQHDLRHETQNTI